MEKMNDLRDLLKHEIEDLQSVEDQIIEALPRMIDKANHPDLKKALSEHLKITEQHKARLEKIMQSIGSENEESNIKKKGIFGIFGSGKQVCKGMKGIIEEGEKIMDADISPEAIDAAIIASAQKVEHYEICGYGTARTFAKELGMDQIAKQLEQTLKEEYEADDLLTNLAIMGINEEAESSKANSSPASAKRRSAGGVKERASKEMELEPVNASRTRSSSREASSKASGSREPKSSTTPRTETGRNGSSTKKAVGNERGSKTSGRGNGHASSSSERGGTSRGHSRGHR